MTDPIEVTDEDRQAAAAYWAGWSYNVPEVDGKIHPLVYAFASVRLAAEARGAAKREAEIVAWLRESIDFYRKHDDGLSGFDGIAQGQAEALEAFLEGDHLADQGEVF